MDGINVINHLHAKPAALRRIVNGCALHEMGGIMMILGRRIVLCASNYFTTAHRAVFAVLGLHAGEFDQHHKPKKTTQSGRFSLNSLRIKAFEC